MIITKQMAIDANLELPLDFYELVSDDGETFLTHRDIEDMYNDMLDECYPDLMIAGFAYCTSRALKDCDPIAYDCGFGDYISSLLSDGWEEIEIAKEEAESKAA